MGRSDCLEVRFNDFCFARDMTGNVRIHAQTAQGGCGSKHEHELLSANHRQG